MHQETSSLMTASEFRQKAWAQLKDAEALLRSRRYDAAVYVCGYAVEFALKARICKTLHWPEYLTTKGFESFKTHKLEVLLVLSGRERHISSKAKAHWSTVKSWDPEARYQPVGKVTRQVACDMIGSAKALIEVLR